MKIYFIRHLKTRGNFEKRYIGRTDESLFDIGKQKTSPELFHIDKIFSSPMKRCLETAKLLCPTLNPVIVNQLKEMDFGRFENKTYDDLKDDPDYINFLNGNDHIPEGENVTMFKKRCVQAFLEIVALSRYDASIMIVCHGGTIMSVMEYFDIEKRGFYSYQIKNGGGYETEYNPDEKTIRILRELC